MKKLIYLALVCVSMTLALAANAANNDYVYSVCVIEGSIGSAFLSCDGSKGVRVELSKAIADLKTKSYTLDSVTSLNATTAQYVYSLLHSTKASIN